MGKLNRTKEKVLFESNLLDGNHLEDCGKAMLSAELVFEYMMERMESIEMDYVSKSNKETVRESEENISMG